MLCYWRNFFIGMLSVLGASNVIGEDFFDVHPGNQPVSYLYAPGILATEMIMGRYCPHFTAITGEKFTFKNAGHTIGQPHSAVVFPEIDLRKPGYFTLNPLTAYLNRIRADLFPLLFRVFKTMYHFEVEDNPDSEYSVVNYDYDFGQANCGQYKDIQAVKEAYHEHQDLYPGTRIILYGDSRGATTLFNFIAECHPSYVDAAVLEAPFDDMDHYIRHLIYTDKEPRTEVRLHSIFSLLCGSYKKDGASAKKYAEIITDDIPLLFVASLKDGLVAPQCTFYLYNRLRERGFKNVHLLVLKHSSHTGYMFDSAQDRALYEMVVHAFYKKYGLPHNSARAQAGQQAFAATQPSAQELQERYGLVQCEFCWKGAGGSKGASTNWRRFFEKQIGTKVVSKENFLVHSKQRQIKEN